MDEPRLPCLMEWCPWSTPYGPGEPSVVALAVRNEHVLNHSIEQSVVELMWLRGRIAELEQSQDLTGPRPQEIQKYQERLVTLRGLLGGAFD